MVLLPHPVNSRGWSPPWFADPSAIEVIGADGVTGDSKRKNPPRRYGGVGFDGTTDFPTELVRFELRPQESELREWGAPGGRGLLTNQRCLLLSYPYLIHRMVRWSVDLEKVSTLSVQAMRGPPDLRVASRGLGWAPGVVPMGSIDPTFSVLVDENPVYIGDPDDCADLQRAIDDARTARCLAVVGRLLPYQGVVVGSTVGAPASGWAAPQVKASAGALEVLGAQFVLFIAGEPFRDAVPSAENPMVTVVDLRGGMGPSDLIGGHVPADHDPGQIYGPQAEIARMVLDIAKKCNVQVKIVDVDDPGGDAPLVERYLSSDDDLPVLIRLDGARLVGEESIVPLKVAEFLQGR
jgi:hypothetical protein